MSTKKGAASAAPFFCPVRFQSPGPNAALVSPAKGTNPSVGCREAISAPYALRLVLAVDARPAATGALATALRIWPSPILFAISERAAA